MYRVGTGDNINLKLFFFGIFWRNTLQSWISLLIQKYENIITKDFSKNLNENLFVLKQILTLIIIYLQKMRWHLKITWIFGKYRFSENPVFLEISVTRQSCFPENHRELRFPENHGSLCLCKRHIFLLLTFWIYNVFQVEKWNIYICNYLKKLKLKLDRFGNDNGKL